MDYRLDGLSPRTFEHLIQSLTHAAVTPEATPFGDGPDGGREATFDGPTNYGPEGHPWHGYGVIQAKFRQRPGQNDTSWAESELRKELHAYSDRGRKRQKPDYYIFATNATLTPAADTGGKDRISRLLKDFAKENNLKGFDIWDYDKIRVLLNNNHSVRIAFAAWIMPGDVLFELAKHLRPQRPDYHKVVINYLQKELLSDQFAKLEQAGHSADEAIHLSQVFVDLPVSVERVRDPDRLERGSRNRLKFATSVVEASKQRFIKGADGTQRGHSAAAAEAVGRIVLIGGPGQGKTTLGQFICQIFRTALLDDVNPNLLDAPAVAAMNGVVKQWEVGQLPRPDARRLPFRIVLSEFAKDLADEKVDSLLDYLGAHISKRAGRNLSGTEVKELLLAYPSILILDGLDEVPASTNRDQLLDCVRDFRIDVVTEQIDVLIIATSRPQGYNEDFSPSLYQHLYLEPLPGTIAMDYARRLTQIRFGQDPTRFDKVIGRLERALKASSTARLMKSPLQVTIMTLLVDRMGQPPQERWTLFSEYYNLIYQREIERDIPAASILRDYRTDIDAIHRRVGMVLQIESERSGGTDSRLTTQQFSGIVASYLNDEGHEEIQLREISASIIEAATNRLVFLVGLESGLVGFEIRSLQEFMAAEGLMDAEDGIAQARLRSIAAVSNWRNVFLFAAGKAFNDRRYLRDTIGQICQELNDEPDDEISTRIDAGSRLALDLLEDGPAGRQPAMSRTLTRLALRLVGTHDDDLINRLVSVFQERTAPIYIEVLGSFLLGPGPHAAQAAFMISRIADVGNTTLNGLVERAKPWLEKPDEKELQSLINIGDGRPGIIRDAITRALPSLKPSEVISLLDKQVHHPTVWSPIETMPAPLASIREFSSLQDGLRRLAARIRLQDGSVAGEARFISIEQPEQVFASGFSFFTENPTWDFLNKIVDLLRSPTRQRLAQAIRSAGEADPTEAELFYYSITPWVLTKAMDVARKDNDWIGTAAAAEAGEFGDVGDWRNTEENLIAGISLSDLHLYVSLLPSAEISFSFDDAYGREVVAALSHPDLRRSAEISYGLHSYINRLRWGGEQGLKPSPWLDELLRILLAGPAKYLGLFALQACQPYDTSSEAWDPHIRAIRGYDFFVHGGAVGGLLKILQACWTRDPSPELFGAYSICLTFSEVTSRDLPQPRLPISRKSYADLLSSAIALDLRKNGDVDRVVDGIRELDDKESHQILVSALRARLRDADYQDQLLKLQGIASEFGKTRLLSTITASLYGIASARKSALMEESTWHRLALPQDLRAAILEHSNPQS
ncbi:NACHT domain-containing protein [Micromonospora sp. WMMD735]|uniref:NACHT domain-containing protein n=1 Tax=Micromonospora sp. WMMD735 TaxID=3404130 RepID=UPI003B939FF7